MWKDYVIAAVLSAIIGLSFYPKQQYRYWWQWLHDERRQVVVSVVGFCVINGALAALAYAGAAATGVGSDHQPLARIAAAVLGTQVVLRGRAPKYGHKADAESTLVRIGTEWLMGDLDKKAVMNVVDLCAALGLGDGIALAEILHASCSERDGSVSPTVTKNERTKIEQARAVAVPGHEGQTSEEQNRVEETQEEQAREMRALCREIILRSHAVLRRSTWKRFFGDAARSAEADTQLP